MFQFCTFFKKFSVANFRSGGEDRTKKKKTQSGDVSQKKSPPQSKRTISSKLG